MNNLQRMRNFLCQSLIVDRVVCLSSFCLCMRESEVQYIKSNNSYLDEIKNQRKIECLEMKIQDAKSVGSYLK